MKKRYAVIGCGGVGGYYGSCLQRAGFDVSFLLRSDYKYVKEHGLRIDSKTGKFTLPDVAAYNDPDDMPESDVVIIALKTTANHILPEVLPKVLKRGGTVLLLQNGLGVEETIAKIVSEHIIGGLCFLCSHKEGPGHIHHIDYGEISLGEFSVSGLPLGVTARMQEIASDFEKAGIKINLDENLQAARWKKLIWNIPFNGLTILLNETTDHLINDPAMSRLIEKIMLEIANASKACARQIEREFIDKMILYTKKMKPYSPSMKLDFDSGLPMEVECIFGNPIREANKNGVEMPLTELMYHQLCYLDAHNRGN